MHTKNSPLTDRAGAVATANVASRKPFHQSRSFYNKCLQLSRAFDNCRGQNWVCAPV